MSFLVLPQVLLHKDSLPRPTQSAREPGFRVPSRNLPGRESSRDGGKGRTEKTKSAASVSFSAGSARREEEAGPAPRPPLSFLYCDWKSEPRPPLPLARSVPFKDKGSNVPAPSLGPVERVTFWRLRRAPSQPVSWRLTDFSTQRLRYF